MGASVCDNSAPSSLCHSRRTEDHRADSSRRIAQFAVRNPHRGRSQNKVIIMPLELLEADILFGHHRRLRDRVLDATKYPGSSRGRQPRTVGK